MEDELVFLFSYTPPSVVIDRVQSSLDSSLMKLISSMRKT